MSETATETISLAADSVLAEALDRAGRKRFTDESFREPMGVLLRSLEEEAGLNAAGRYTMRTRVVDILVNRLRLEEYLERHPEIRDEEISVAYVIVGLPRSGTTMLHRLLSCDPKTNAVIWWETRNPAPFPGTDWKGTDPRIPEAHEQVRQILEAVPELATIHPWDPEGPDEEILLLEHAFLSTTPPSMANVPSYDAWMKAQDQQPAYDFLYLMLQFLQWQKRQAGRNGERWVLKTPQHLGCVDNVFRTFPGARIIQTHRDPLQTLPSISSMYYSLWRLAADDPDPLLVGSQAKEHYVDWLGRCMEARDRMPAERFIDVDYRAVVRDPIGEVRSIYDLLGFELSDELIKEMQWWVEENRRDKRAPHAYTLEKFGFTEEAILEAFAEYRQRHIEG